MEKLGQEQAFPAVYSYGDENQFTGYYEGMTKRFYAACAAMHGLLANPERYKYIKKAIESGKLTQEQATEKNIKKAYYLADELLKQENL